MYLIEKDTELSVEQLGKILQSFQSDELLTLRKFYDYFKGNQAIKKNRNIWFDSNGVVHTNEISNQKSAIVTNYCAGIVSNYSGYLTGKDIAYVSDNQNFEEVQDVLNYNDCHSADSNYLIDALIFGRASEIMWIDEDGQIRFKPISPMSTIPVYDDTITQNLVYGIRFYDADFITHSQKQYFVEVYDANKVRRYKSGAGFASFTLLDEQPHFFGQVPITFFDLNREQDSIYADVLDLQDAYNSLLSGELDAWNAFCDAYMIFKGVNIDNDQVTSLKDNRILMIDEGADIQYLTKDTTTQDVENMMQTVNDQIHLVALSPDFNDEKFLSQSGIALKYKLIGFENRAGQIEAQMKKALQRRIELICGVLNLKGADTTWRDVDIIFTRNLPADIGEIVNEVNGFRGLVSDETLLTQIPFVTDAKAELERLEKQNQKNMELYSFENAEDEEEDEYEDKEEVNE